MNRSHVRALQRKLAETDHYRGAIDGVRGPDTHRAVAAAMAGLGPLPAGFADWSGRRQTIAFLQAYAAEQGIEAGAIDGLWGPQTDYAADALLERLETGTVRLFQNETPGTANPHGFPPETRDQAALRAAFGPPGEPGGFRPPLVRVPLPWPMKISFMPRERRQHLWAHEAVAESLTRVLARLDARFSAAQKADLGLDIFGGDYAPRTMRGADRHSLHSWGIAFDFDPDRNPLHANRLDARLGQPDAIPFWEAWEAEGWCSLGRHRNFDFMHVQAAMRSY